MSELLKEAIAGLGINVPIYRTEEQDGTLTLYLYGGRVVRWPPHEMATADGGPDPDPVTTSPRTVTAGADLQDPPVTTDDLTVIPGIGKATAQALNKAGFTTFHSLINATDAAILDVPTLNTYVLGKIRSYL